MIFLRKIFLPDSFGWWNEIMGEYVQIRWWYSAEAGKAKFWFFLLLLLLLFLIHLEQRKHHEYGWGDTQTWSHLRPCDQSAESNIKISHRVCHNHWKQHHSPDQSEQDSWQESKYFKWVPKFNWICRRSHLFDELMNDPDDYVSCIMYQTKCFER